MITSPRGAEVSVVVPEGVVPGELFTCEVPDGVEEEAAALALRETEVLNDPAQARLNLANADKD